MAKTKWRPKWCPPRYLCLLYLFKRSTDFHQIFTKNLEIHFPTYRNLLEFQYGGKQNGIQNGVHLDICVYCISSTVQPIFIKFSPKISQYISNLEESVIISIWHKTKWHPKWRPTRYLCLLYLFNRSTDFHQIFTKNLEIYFPTYRNLLEFQNDGKQNGIQNGVHLDICVYCISSTVQPIFIKFSLKISKYISKLIGICQIFNMAENKMVSKMAST